MTLSDDRKGLRIEIAKLSDIAVSPPEKPSIAKASKTLRDLRWFEIVETRGQIENGKIAYWQVTLKLGFTLED